MSYDRPAPPDRGTQFGGYVLCRELGRGGQGCVHLAWDNSLYRYVALKMMHPGVAATPANRQRFARERQIMARLDHPYLVPIYSTGVIDQTEYLVMPYLHGGPLVRWLSAEPRLSVSAVMLIGHQALLGLAALCTAGVIHRDVKPANLFLQHWPRRGFRRVRWIDYGLARPPAEQLESQSNVFGTPAYMSPEQHRGAELDDRTDVFSMGVVLYELLTGTHPFRRSAAGGFEFVSAVLSRSPRPLGELNPVVPDWLAALVTDMLAKSPRARPSAADAAAVLGRRK